MHKDISIFKPGERASSMHVNRIERPKPISSVQKPETRKPPVQRGQPGGGSAQREFGVAPQHQDQSSALPAQRKELGPSRQISKPAPPAARPQPNPRAQMTRPAPPAPKAPSGSSVQRNIGVVPPHVAQPSAPPAQSQPQGASPGIPHTGIKEKDKR